MDNVIIELKNIKKSFSGVHVLHDVNFTLKRGEILGFIGENGAGKSTLMKILSGIYTPDSGEIYISGKKVEVKSPKDARKNGISLVPQEFNLCNNLSVVENIFLGSEIMKGNVLEEKTMKNLAEESLKSLNVNFNVDSKIENLSAAGKQFVEIAKSIAFNLSVLIMDEPTTMLTIKEIENLFNLMQKLKNKGMSIIYISHKLEEIKNICERVLILRDGYLVHESDVKNISTMEMASKMVGRELSQIFPKKTEPQESIFFEVKNIESENVFKNISFNVKKGEIYGLAGLVGAGRTEVAEAIMGIRNFTGEIFLDGKKINTQKPKDAIDAGISYLSEDRQASGIITTFNVAENTTLSSLDKYSKNLIQKINFKEEEKSANEYKNLFKIKTTSIKETLEHLSGGNQQKVSLAKSMDTKPKVLIVDEPTRGVDISAKQEIYQFLSSLARGGLSIILISSELNEIIGMCNRVLVLKEGIATGELKENELTEEEIMFYATGIRKGETR